MFELKGTLKIYIPAKKLYIDFLTNRINFSIQHIYVRKLEAYSTYSKETSNFDLNILSWKLYRKWFTNKTISNFKKIKRQFKSKISLLHLHFNKNKLSSKMDGLIKSYVIKLKSEISDSRMDWILKYSNLIQIKDNFSLLRPLNVNTRCTGM